MKSYNYSKRVTDQLDELDHKVDVTISPTLEVLTYIEEAARIKTQQEIASGYRTTYDPPVTVEEFIEMAAFNVAKTFISMQGE